MANNEEHSFHYRLPRKELQSLCKKYGLPANRSSSEMAKSLVPYLENQRFGSMITEQRSYGFHEAGTSLNSFRDAEKDCYGLISCPIDRGNGGNYSQAVKFNAFGCCTGDKFYHKDGGSGGAIFFQPKLQSQFINQYTDHGFKNKESSTICFDRNSSSLTRDGRMNSMPQIELKDTNVGACSIEAACSSCIDIPAVSPSSFQFHVSSAEGINLCVDLNSNPSDWVEKLGSEVSICQKKSRGKSHTFHKELGRFGESSKQMKSSIQLNVDAAKLKAVELRGHLEGDQGLTLSKAHPDTQEQIILDDTSSVDRGCSTTLDLNINSPRENFTSDAVVNISNGPLNLPTVKHRSSKLEHEIVENSTLQNGCKPVNLGGIIPRCLPEDSLQITMAKDVVHHKDALHSSCENGEFVELVDPKHNIYGKQGGLVGSVELDIQGSFRSRMPTVVEEQEAMSHREWCDAMMEEIHASTNRTHCIWSNQLGLSLRPSIERSGLPYEEIREVVQEFGLKKKQLA